MSFDQRDYISLTDMAKARTDATRAADVIKNWLRTRSTLEFLGTWEVMYNPDFKVVEFDHFRSEAGLHTFTLSAKEWIEKTNATGMYVQAGRYYKCVSVKKKRTECHKRPVRKEWIEDLVVGETMKMVMDDKAIEAIVSMLMDLQDRDNVNVPLYEQQLREADTAISNLLGAIQQGILTRSTKERLEELENRRDELENRLACEKLAKPKVSAEFMTFWLHRFRKLDVRQQSHCKMLIDTFINAIFLYDDKMVITFNYKEGTKTSTFAELQEAISDKNGSDLDCLAAPLRNDLCMSDDRASAFISTAKVFLRSNPQSLRWIAGLYSKFGS